MNKSEFLIRERRHFSLPGGEWSVDKADFETVFEVSELPQEIVGGWRCSSRSKLFGMRELQQIHRFKLTPSGMEKCLGEFGPFVYPFTEWGDVLRVGERLKGPTFATWWKDAILIQRAYSLWWHIRSGKFFKWETVLDGPSSYYRLLNWPVKLRTCKGNETGRFVLFFREVSGVRREPVRVHDGFTYRAAIGDDEVSRTLAKLLLAKYIDEGLSENPKPFGFSYDPVRDTFRTDIAETDILKQCAKSSVWMRVSSGTPPDIPS